VATRSAARRRPVARSEEGAAARSVVLLVSVVVGALITLFESIDAVPIGVAMATLALALALAARTDAIQPWVAALLWATLLVGAEGLGVVPPAMMVSVCVALALGPDRVLEWAAEDWGGRATPEPESGWIEER
jgi:hypothetical protein